MFWRFPSIFAVGVTQPADEVLRFAMICSFGQNFIHTVLKFAVDKFTNRLRDVLVSGLIWFEVFNMEDGVQSGITWSQHEFV